MPRGRGFGACLRRWGWAPLAVCVALAPAAARGQAPVLDAFVAPQAGWSEFRRLVVGGQAGLRLLGGLEVAGEGLLFFPDEASATERGVHVDRNAWQLNAHLLYSFDRTRRLIVYAGPGASWARNTRSVVVDGVRSRLELTGWAATVLFGARWPRPYGEPFAEWRTELTRESQWVVTAGVRLALPGG
ncbi:MAG: hypothetical protein RJQ04_19065 [Longimicrobiales bacterium]